MSDFVEPETFEDYLANRTSLIEAKTILVAKLASMNAMIGGKNKRERHAELSRQYAEIELKLSRLKQWAKANAAKLGHDKERWVVVENAEDRKRLAADRFTAFRQSFADLYEYVKFLEQQVSDQKAEIETLKAEQPKEIVF